MILLLQCSQTRIVACTWLKSFLIEDTTFLSSLFNNMPTDDEDIQDFGNSCIWFLGVSKGMFSCFILQCTWSLSMMVRGATELETLVVSVERVKEYSEVEQEVGGISSYDSAEMWRPAIRSTVHSHVKKIETYVKSCLYNTTMRSWYIAVVALHSTRDHSEYGLSQWETTLPCNVVSRWLSPCPKDPWVRTTQNNTIPNIARLNITRYTCSITVTKVKEETNLKPIT